LGHQLTQPLHDFWFICSCNQRRYFSLSLQFKQLRQDAVFQSGGTRPSSG
jgi:hypothetical protein